MVSFYSVQTLVQSELPELIRWIHSKGWAPGTGGNFSEVISDSPLELLMSPSGIDKGDCSHDNMLLVNESGATVTGIGKPSAETLIHVAIARQTDAKVIVHTHSIWNTIASLSPHPDYRIGGFEMLKGLRGITTHDHMEYIPIFENSQDIAGLSAKIESKLKERPETHGILLRGHGLYTWGSSIAEAKRHLEVLEFLFEIQGQLARTAN